MAFSSDLFFAPAHKLAAMLKAREVSATELVDQFLERIESVNRNLNAVVTLVEERAIEEAADSDKRLAKKAGARPLEGLPITIKDSIITAGVRSTWGMKIFEHHIATTDAPSVARLRAAGAIVIAKTNTPEMTLDYDCDNPVFGATNNPWNHQRVPGGSSGGEAAALAAGMSPLGMGSDYGGSIRVPSHFCGVSGLKPSWGTIPTSGHMSPGAPPPPIAHMATIGPMARFVDDLTLAYNIVKGPHPSFPYTVPTPEAHPERVEVKKIRVGFFTAAGEVPVAREIREATVRAAHALSKVGVTVEEVKPPVEDAARLWFDYAMADGGALLAGLINDKMHLSRERLRNLLSSAGPGKTAAEYFVISIVRDTWRTKLAEFMERYPILVLPPFCITAFPHGATEVDIDGKSFPIFAANWPVLIGNCAGLPGAVVPAGKDKDGLPIGVQVMGRAFAEEEVLAVAKVLEQELGGFKRPAL
ncbi:MAG: amidase [Candidatus Binataceae bacterium]